MIQKWFFLLKNGDFHESFFLLIQRKASILKAADNFCYAFMRHNYHVKAHHKIPKHLRGFPTS